MHEENNYVILKAATTQIAINNSVVQKFKAIQKSGSFQKERGGILVGYYEGVIESLIISDITYPQANDIGSRFSFLRKSFGHQEIMDELWEKSGYKKSYLGEWHTHNQKIPAPSFIDTRNWMKISRRRHNFDEVYYVIIGIDNIGIWGITNGDIIKIGYI